MSTKTEKAPEAKAPLVITCDADCVELVKGKDKKDKYKITIVKSLEFITDAIAADETLAKFIEDAVTRKFIAGKVGVPGLLSAYEKDEVLKAVDWPYVKQFFMDHIDRGEILDHIGFEFVKEHFADKIDSAPSQQKSINTGSKSLLETLNDTEGKNS